MTELTNLVLWYALNAFLIAAPFAIVILPHKIHWWAMMTDPLLLVAWIFVFDFMSKYLSGKI